MNRENLFELAEKAGLGFVRHASEKDIEKFEKLAELAQVSRNDVLEEVAQEFDKMPFGDTAASFARYVRDMKNAKTKAS